MSGRLIPLDARSLCSERACVMWPATSPWQVFRATQMFRPALCPVLRGPGRTCGPGICTIPRNPLTPLEKPVKVYVAARGEPGEYDYEVLRAFAHREDAEAFELTDHIVELDLDEGPLEVRPRHVVTWDYALDRPPSISVYDAGFDGRPDSEEHHDASSLVQAETWDQAKARALFEAKQAEFEARRDELAAALLERLYTIYVQVWYEPGDGTAVLLTPLHATDDHFAVPRDLITEQAGMPNGATLHGKWFEVRALTYKTVDGFSTCAKPHKESLATSSPTPVQPFRRVP